MSASNFEHILERVDGRMVSSLQKLENPEALSQKFSLYPLDLEFVEKTAEVRRVLR